MDTKLHVVDLQPEDPTDPLSCLEAVMLRRPAVLFFDTSSDRQESRAWLARHGIRMIGTKTIAIVQCEGCGASWTTSWNNEVGTCPRGPHLKLVK